MATAAAKVKRSFREVRRGRPGHRFQDYYQRTRRSKNQASAAGRVIRISAALVAFTIGCVLAVIPGPAIPFFFIAGALLAAESKVVARLMDGIELRSRAIFKWGHERWRRLPPLARIGVAILMAGISVTATVFSYRLLRG